jgi:hypothetical protein
MLAMRALAALFLGVLFLQSGLDKVTDRKGNLKWLTGHFAKSPLSGVVPLVLPGGAGGDRAPGALIEPSPSLGQRDDATRSRLQCPRVPRWRTFAYG